MSVMRDKMSANFQVRSFYLRDSHGKTILTNLTQSFLSITIPMVKMCIASFFSSILVFFFYKNSCTGMYKVQRVNGRTCFITCVCVYASCARVHSWIFTKICGSSLLS